MHCHPDWSSLQFRIPVIVALSNIKVSANSRRSIIEWCQDKQSLVRCVESIADHFHSLKKRNYFFCLPCIFYLILLLCEGFQVGKHWQTHTSATHPYLQTNVFPFRRNRTVNNYLYRYSYTSSQTNMLKNTEYGTVICALHSHNGEQRLHNII